MGANNAPVKATKTGKGRPKFTLKGRDRAGIQRPERNQMTGINFSWGEPYGKSPGYWQYYSDPMSLVKPASPLKDGSRKVNTYPSNRNSKNKGVS